MSHLPAPLDDAKGPLSARQLNEARRAQAKTELEIFKHTLGRRLLTDFDRADSQAVADASQAAFTAEADLMDYGLARAWAVGRQGGTYRAPRRAGGPDQRPADHPPLWSVRGMTWLFIVLGALALLALVTAWRRKTRREKRIDPATYQVMADLYAIRRRLGVALFKLQLSRDTAEARRRLSAELDEVEDATAPAKEQA